jgi:hypothetical protein
MKRVAILQSNYIPWKGYFDLIASVDYFVLYDDAQFTKNDWRNRNRIKTQGGVEWISVPVGTDINRRIRDVTLPDKRWQVKHWAMLQSNYGRAPFFRACAEWLQPIFLEQRHETLSALNRTLIEAICRFLGIHTQLFWSWEFHLPVGRVERLVDICVQLGAKEYVSGPAAKGYIDESIFNRSGISLSWFSYDGYPEYPQMWGRFEHAVSVVDLLFNCGTDSPRFMKLGK